MRDPRQAQQFPLAPSPASLAQLSAWLADQNQSMAHRPELPHGTSWNSQALDCFEPAWGVWAAACTTVLFISRIGE